MGNIKVKRNELRRSNLFYNGGVYAKLLDIIKLDEISSHAKGGKQ
jgi:hypothetical protein